MNARLLLPLSLVFAQAATLIVQILVPRFLGPEEFTAFSLCWTYAQFVVIVAFEWMRSATIRFSMGADRLAAVKRRRVLTRLYALISAALLGLSVTCFVFSLWWQWAGAIAAAAAYAAFRGLFEGAQAIARAELKNMRFVSTWLTGSILSLILTLTFAWVSKSGLVAFWGMSLSFGLAASFHYFLKLLRGFSPKTWDSEQFIFLRQYGTYIALTSVLTSLMPPLVRSMVALGVGKFEGAGALLALDLSQKLLASVGLAFNLVFVQYAIRIAEYGSREELIRRLTFQTAAAAAIIFPAGIGFLVIQPNLLDLLIPEPYRHSYLIAVTLATLSACLMAFKSYGIDALFVVVGRSNRAVIGPVTALCVACICAWAGAYVFQQSLKLILAAQFIGLATGALVSMYYARKETKIRWPFFEFGKVALGCVIIAASVGSIPGSGGAGHLAICVLVGTMVYCFYAFISDLCGIRSRILSTKLF